MRQNRQKQCIKSRIIQEVEKVIGEWVAVTKQRGSQRNVQITEVDRIVIQNTSTSECSDKGPYRIWLQQMTSYAEQLNDKQLLVNVF